jgi:transcription elongation factor GreA
MASPSGSPSPDRGAERPIYLTAAGRRQLESRLASDLAERQRLAPVDPTDVRDSADEADRLEAADELARLDGRIEAARLLLSRARPLAPGPDDHIVQRGSTVTLRDDRGETSTLTLVDPIEADLVEAAVALDAPVGAALVGRRIGDRVAVSTPDGDRTLEIVGVRPYRPA